MTTEHTTPEADYKAAQAEAKAAAARAKALRPWYRKKRFIIGIPVAAFIVLAIVSDGSGTSTGASSRTDRATPASTQAALTKATEPDSSLTTSQRNAVRSAKSYLNISGFSRQGLINQLSSDFGDKYPVADATVAVDSLNVDWDAQAVRSAKSYLKISGFSCQGLIKQLSSDFGDKYTTSQATYGATQAGLC